MKLNPGTRNAWLGGVVVALTWIVVGVEMAGQTRPVPGPLIRSLSEPSQSLEVKDVSARTGLVTFATTRDSGLLLERTQTAPADARALDFVDLYGQAFGLSGRSDVAIARMTPVDALGFEHVRLQQLHRGIPVTGSQLVVHLKGARVHGANGEMVTDLPGDVTPAITPDAALAQARTLVEKHYGRAVARLTTPRLEIFNRAVLDHRSAPSQLAWFIEAGAASVREFIWIDAERGDVLLNFNQRPHAKNRLVFSAGGGSGLPGTLVRPEGGPPTGDPDIDAAYDFSGLAYDYFFVNHGRDSYDGFGATIESTAHFNDGSCPNAFWDGFGMVFCTGLARADDVVAHEFTHAVTEYSADLFYFVQAGALNESFSDIFGETADLLNGVGNDTPGQRWSLGEDLSTGSMRNMSNPTAHGSPGKMSDAQFECDPSTDGGGVHKNSGVPNHAYALMVDGGTYNGFTVSGIGLIKAARIQYQALTGYLTPGASFRDAFYAINQSCSDLVGTAGITVSDCVQVTNAMLAVEMNATFGCHAPPVTVSACPAGGVPVHAFQDGFETATPPWSMQSTTATSWFFSNSFPNEGLFSARGPNGGSTSDHRLFMSAPVVVPAGGRLIFEHAFEFETDGPNGYDGGVIEFSTNGGGLWTDAGSLIDGGRPYRGAIATGTGNPLQGRPAFIKGTLGYVRTRLNLASLVGQNVQFRFRVGTDSSVSARGWLVDDVALYSCAVTAGAPTIVTPPAAQTKALGAGAVFSVVAGGNGPLKYQWLKNGIAIAGAQLDTLALANVQDADNGHYSVIVSNGVGTAVTDGAPLTVIGVGAWAGNTNLNRPHNFVVNATGTGLTQLTYSATFSCTTVTTTVSTSIPIDPASGSFTFDNGPNSCGSRVQTTGSFTGAGTATGSATITLSNSSFGCPVPCNGVRAVTWTAALGGPAFVSQPANRTVVSGGTVQFAADATGAPAPTFQWQVSTDGISFTPLSNGAPYSGVTTNTLVITGASGALTGLQYRVVATNAGGSATSDAATLTVTTPQFIQNGDFSNGLTGWFPFGSPPSAISFSVVGGVFQYFRNQAPGTPGQAVVAQHTGVKVGANVGLSAQFDLGNSSSVRKRIAVLMLDSSFADQSVCTFFLEPFAPMRTYRMRMHTTQPWNDAAIYFYAATPGSNGGNYLLDNVAMQVDPDVSTLRTDCVDPTTLPGAGGAVGPNLVANGDFSNGTSTWFTEGLTHQVSGNVFEFLRPTAAPPAGVIVHAIGPVAAGEILTAVFDLGNSSALRRRVTVLVHDLDFSDLQVCTFFLSPGQPLSTYEIRTHTTEAWANGAIAFYVASVGLEQWYRLDNVGVHRTPGLSTFGTECMEPGSALPSAFRQAAPAPIAPATGAIQPSADPSTSWEAEGFTVAGSSVSGGPVWRAVANVTGWQTLAWPLTVDLTARSDARLRFRSRLSDGGSAGQVQVSLDGTTWQTVAAVPRSDEWLDLDVDLGAFAGSILSVRLVFEAVAPASGRSPDVWLIEAVTVAGDPTVARAPGLPASTGPLAARFGVPMNARRRRRPPSLE